MLFRSYTASILSLNDEWDPDDDGMFYDLEKVYPVTGDSTISNAAKTGRIIFNASKARGYSFKAADAKLIVTDYTVTAPGNADIEMKIDIIARTGPEVEKIVNKGVVQPGFVFVQHTTFDPNYTVSYDVQPTEPAPTELEPQPTEPAPTEHTHTPATIVRENEVPATCTAEGSYDEVVYCSACGEEISRTHKTIAKLAHNLIYVAEVPATYEVEGVKAHYECTVCHKL